MKIFRGASGLAIAVATSLAPIASGEPVLLSLLPNLDPYAVVNPADYAVMDGRWYAFAGPADVTCVINTTNSSYGCSGPLPGAPGGSNLVSAAATGPPAFSTTEQPVFAAAGDVRALAPNTRLSFGHISCGADASGAVTCVNSRDQVGFSVNPTVTFISGFGASGVGRIFTGDYCTGDLSQWSQTQIAGGSSPGARFWPEYRDLLTDYPIAVVREDTDCGYAARFEIRPGDSGSENERAEVAGPATAINVTRWEAFSVKFDETYPLSIDEGWVVTNQWADASGLSWAFSENHLDGITPPGMWTLTYFGGVDRSIRLLDVPMDRGNWIDVKMHIGWYDSDELGFVKVWINGVRQTLRYGSWEAPGLVAPRLSPSDTFTGQTVWNNTSGTFYYKEGLYRGREYDFPTGVVYHANYRTAADEASL